MKGHFANFLAGKLETTCSFSRPFRGVGPAINASLRLNENEYRGCPSSRLIQFYRPTKGQGQNHKLPYAMGKDRKEDRNRIKFTIRSAEPLSKVAARTDAEGDSKLNVTGINLWGGRRRRLKEVLINGPRSSDSC